MNYPLTYEEFKTIYAKVPRLNVELVVRTEEGVLLTKREITPYKGMWHIPGGTVYFGETLHQAVERVAKHELGVEVEIGKLLGYIEYPSKEYEGEFKGWPIGIAFEVTLMQFDIKNSDQSSEAKFFKALPDLLIEDQRQFLESLAG